MRVQWAHQCHSTGQRGGVKLSRPDNWFIVISSVAMDIQNIDHLSRANICQNIQIDDYHIFKITDKTGNVPSGSFNTNHSPWALVRKHWDFNVDIEARFGAACYNFTYKYKQSTQKQIEEILDRCSKVKECILKIYSRIKSNNWSRRHGVALALSIAAI